MVEERGYMLEEFGCRLEVHIYMDGGAQLNAGGASLYAGAAQLYARGAGHALY